MMNIPERTAVMRLLTALSEQLALDGHETEMVVVGGSGLLALDQTVRPTRDIDVVAFVVEKRLVSATPFPAFLTTSADRVAADFGLTPDWLNPGPASLMDFGLPDGFEDRMRTKAFEPSLTVHFASRLDQIHLKLYATVDQGPGKHEQDLTNLAPTEEELLQAARWSMTQDPSEGYESMLTDALESMGVRDAARRV